MQQRDMHQVIHYFNFIMVIFCFKLYSHIVYSPLNSYAYIHWILNFKYMIIIIMLIQLNKCVVCGSDLQRGHSGDGRLSSSILFKYESSRGHLFVLSWARIRRVALGSDVR